MPRSPPLARPRIVARCSVLLVTSAGLACGSGGPAPGLSQSPGDALGAPYVIGITESSARLLWHDLPPDAQLSARHADDLLGGVTVIEGKAAAPANQPWSRQLYRDVTLATAAARTIDLRLIPYFAWDNRGKSERTVWIS